MFYSQHVRSSLLSEELLGFQVEGRGLGGQRSPHPQLLRLRSYDAGGQKDSAEGKVQCMQLLSAALLSPANAARSRWNSLQ